MLLKVAPFLLVASVYFTGDAASSEVGSKGTECEVITVNTCRGNSVIHKYTRVPTFRRVSTNPDDGSISYRNQKRAMEGKRELVSRLKGRATKACKALMKPFVCAAYLPFCDESSEAIPPCRSFCNKAQTMCQEHLDKLGLEWPYDLDCSLFPTSSENPRCLSALNVNEPSLTILPSSAEVIVKCHYDLSPRKRPSWLINGVLVEEHSDRMQNMHDRSTSYSTFLVIRNFVDSVDRGNYTCAVGEPGNYEFERQISLDNIYEPDPVNTTVATTVTQGGCRPIQNHDCTDALQYSHAFMAPPPPGVGGAPGGALLQIYPLLQGSCPGVVPRMLLCLLVFPKCELDSAEVGLPCQELCQLVMRICADGMPGIADDCMAFPSQKSIKTCHNGLEIGVVKTALVEGSHRVEVNCSYLIDANQSPTWLDSSFRRVDFSSASRVRMERQNSYTIKLVIENYNSASDDGTYTCSINDFYKAIELSDIPVPGQPGENDIRLRHGTIPRAGLLEVFYNGEWGTVCGRGWDVVDAGVACRQLGFAGPRALHNYMISSDSSVYDLMPVMLEEIGCTGTEDSLLDCPKSDWHVTSSYCSHDNDVKLACHKEDIDLVVNYLITTETGDGGLNVSIDCSSEHLDYYLDEVPVWTLPSGVKIAVFESVNNVRAQYYGALVNQLIFSGFTDEENGGEYTCSVTGYSRTITLTRDTIANAAENPCKSDEFNCGEKCVPSRFLCDDEEDCANGQDEAYSLCWPDFVDPSSCPTGQIPCPSGDRCIPMSALCDGVPDCRSGMDEMDCEDGGSDPPSECPPGQIPCPSGDQCIPISALCDGVEDCTSGVDERDCEDGGPVPPSECPPGQIPCPSGDQCIPISALCDGVEDCTSGMDEMDCEDGGPVPPSECPPGQIPCPSGDQCIPVSALCDGVEDCTSGMDEMDCEGGGPVSHSECPPGQISCPSGDQCIPVSALCDGVEDCTSGMDEVDCARNEDRPPSIPHDLQMTPSSHSISVSWQPPMDDDVLIQGYIMGYGNDVPDELVFRLQSSPTEYIITNLEPNTFYVIKLRAFNKAGEGTSIYQDIMTTSASEDRPPSIPHDLQMTPSSHSISVSWQPPMDDDVLIQGYIMGYGNDVPDELVFRLQSSPTEYIITNLEPNTFYVIKLRAFNKAGEGAPIYQDIMTTSASGSTPCPAGHLPCPLSDKCIPLSAVCDGQLDCSSGMDEMDCEEGAVPPPECPPGQIPCPVGDQCIPLSALCNGVPECSGGFDELACDEGGAVPPFDECPPGQIPCPVGDQCIPLSALCNGVPECSGGFDEMACDEGGFVPPSECPPGQIPCPSGDQCIPISALCDGVEDCTSGMDEMDCEDGGFVPPSVDCPVDEIPCLSGDECFPLSALCDGVTDCASGMDEMNCRGGGPVLPSECPPGQIPCPSGDQCIPIFAMCDGVEDCSGGYDELQCNVTVQVPVMHDCAVGELPCPLGDRCFSVSALCDGVADCDGGMDELNCPDITSCLPITVPQCAVGLDYTETLSSVPLEGLTPQTIGELLGAMSPVFDSACGTFFRPFICSTFLPPCGQRVRPPCRELCQVAIKTCLEAFEGTLTEADLMAAGGPGSNGGCDALPSEADGQCYNVKEVTIGRMVAPDSESSSVRHVDCTYNLLPEVQPKWVTPSGSKVKTGHRRQVQAIYISDTITRLQISNPDIAGVFTCSGLEYSETVEFY